MLAGGTVRGLSRGWNYQAGGPREGQGRGQGVREEDAEHSSVDVARKGLGGCVPSFQAVWNCCARS